MPPDDTYSARQSERDREYLQSWNDAPASFKESARDRIAELEKEMQRLKRLEPHIEAEHQEVMEYQVNYHTAGYTVDIAGALDSQVDVLVEIHGDDARPIIQDVVNRVTELAEQKVAQDNSLKLARVVMWLVQSDGKTNMSARSHALMHSIPRMAVHCGFPSMRASARECKVSVEWIRKSRLLLCKQLNLPIPEESSKSDEAKLKYKEAGTNGHWRRQIFKPKPPTPCRPILKRTASSTSPSPPPPTTAPLERSSMAS